MNIKSTLGAVAIVGMLVISADYAAQAATGGSFILGRSNGASKTTALTNSGTGAVLKLRTTAPGTRPPLAVNSSVKVANLNADMVDGKHASQLGVQTRIYRTAINESGVGELNVTVPSVAVGRYVVSYSAWLYSNANTNSWCWLDLGVGSVTSGNSSNNVNSQGYQPVNGTGFLNITSASNVRLHCEYNGSVSITSFSGAPMEITFTKVDVVTGNIPPAPQRQQARGSATH